MVSDVHCLHTVSHRLGKRIWMFHPDVLTTFVGLCVVALTEVNFHQLMIEKCFKVSFLNDILIFVKV